MFKSVFPPQRALVTITFEGEAIQVEEGTTVRYSIVAEKAVIAKGAEVGGSPSDSDADNWGVAVVAEGVRIGSGAKLAAKEMADEDLPDVK